jgi:hypothetical protein
VAIVSFCFPSVRCFFVGSVAALVPPGPNHQQYYSTSGAPPIGSNGLIAHIDASRYRGKPTDNPGLPGSIRRTVIQEKLGVSASYPLLLNNTRSLIGTVSVYAAHTSRKRGVFVSALLMRRADAPDVHQFAADFNGAHRRVSHRSIALRCTRGAFETHRASRAAARRARCAAFRRCSTKRQRCFAVFSQPSTTPYHCPARTACQMGGSRRHDNRRPRL